jgi:hypothetical protein
MPHPNCYSSLSPLPLPLPDSSLTRHLFFAGGGGKKLINKIPFYKAAMGQIKEPIYFNTKALAPL